MNQEGMNQILTDAEITLIIRECARGSAINRDGSTSHRIARAIEQAILNKLGEQEPVAWLQTSVEDGVDTVIARTYKPDKFNAEWWRFDPLFTNPATSVPEGYQLVPIEPTEAMQEAWDGESSLMGTWNAMLAAARSK